MLQQQIEGKYELLGRFEDEGGAEVYKVRHLFLDEVRLIKAVHPPGLAISQEVTERFLREARAAIKLRHPNIAQLHDFTIDAEGTAFIVTELIEGLTLEEALAQEGPPPVALTLAVAQQALHALGYLHRARMVHRDISPGKLMLTRDVDGQAFVKWVDLGTAQVLATGEGLPAGPGGLPARPRYASPEQFSAEGATDARSDLYSFGVVLYELLTGRCPIAGHDPFSWMVGHLSTPPLPFTDSDPEGRVPAELREIVLSTLAKKPEERVASAAELARRLARLPALPEDDGAYLDRVMRRALQRQAAVVPVPTTAAATAPAPAAEKAAPAAPAPAKTVALPLAAALPPAVAAPRGISPPAAPVPVEPARHAESPARLWEPIASPPSERRSADLAWDQQDLPAQPLRSDPALRRNKPDPAVELPPPAPADEEPRRSRPTAALLAGGGLLLAGALVGLGWWFGGSRQAEEPVPVQATTPSPLPPPLVETVIVQEAPTPQEFEPLPGARSAAERDRRRDKPLVSLPYIPPSDADAGEIPQDRAKLLVPGPGFQPPEAQTPPKAVYPAAARGTGRQPVIKVAVLVDQNGNVIRARVTDGDRSQLGFNEAARVAAMRVRFFPATQNGEPGPAWSDLICTFEDPGAPAPAPPPPSPPVAAVPPPVRAPGLFPSPAPTEIPTEETVAPEPIATEPPL